MTEVKYAIETLGDVENGLYYTTFEDAKEEIENRLNTYGYAEGMTKEDYYIIKLITITERYPMILI